LRLSEAGILAIVTRTPLLFFSNLQRHHFAWLSIGAALTTILLKALAWWLTGSVGLASDALESFVNLAGSSFALWMILITRRPPDQDHPFGHGKAEYFSSGFEGILIIGAAVAMVVAGLERLLRPLPLESLGLGLVVSGLATLINFCVAQALRRAGKRFQSIALQADAKHLMTDVATSVGVLVGIGLVAWTGWALLDPLVAMAVGLHILLEGGRLIRAAVDGLMDRSLDPDQHQALRAILDEWGARGVRWRDLRTRRAGTEAWVHVVLQMPEAWSVSLAHQAAQEIKMACEATISSARVIIQIEPAPSS